jgi:uncharacterized protein
MHRLSLIRSAAIPALLLALVLPTAARADDASQRTKAEELMTLENTQKVVQQIADTITRQVDEAADRAATTDTTPDQKAKVDQFKKNAAQSIDAKLGWAAMKPAVVDIYMKSFTEDQLDAIIAFYKTPAGAALLEKLPQINTQFGQIGNSRIAELRGDLQKSFQDLQGNLHPTPTLNSLPPAMPPAPIAPAAAPKGPPSAPGAAK